MDPAVLQNTSDLIKRMTDLREKHKSEHKETDQLKFDKEQRELRNELAIKAAEVTELRQELDKSNLTIHELKRELDRTKSALEMHELNLTLSKKKYHTLEEKWQKDQDARLQNQIQCNLMKSEIATLKEHTQRVAVEKYELNRKVGEFEARHKHHVVFQDELERRQAKFETSFRENKTAIEKFAVEHESLKMKLSEATETIDQLNSRCLFFIKENARIKEEKTKFELDFIKTKAQCDKFEELINKHPDITDKDSIMKIIHAHWTKSSAQYKQLLTVKNDIVNKLMKTLKSENETNVKLILREEQQATKIRDLEEKLTENESLLQELEAFKTQNENNKESVQVKTEIIEVIDE